MTVKISRREMRRVQQTYRKYAVRAYVAADTVAKWARMFSTM